MGISFGVGIYGEHMGDPYVPGFNPNLGPDWWDQLRSGMSTGWGMNAFPSSAGTSPGWPGGGGGGGVTMTDLLIGGSQVLGGLLSDSAARRESRRQRDWQEDFYKHRYQYQMADMRAAGLNPILAYSQAPPGVPSGGMAPQGEAGRGVAAAGGSVLDAISRRNAISIQNSTAKRADADARSAAAQADIDEATRDAELAREQKYGTITVRGRAVAGNPEPGRSRLEHRLDNALEATSSSAQQNRAHAEYFDALRNMTPAQQRQIENAIKNADVQESTRLLVEVGKVSADIAAQIVGQLVKKPANIFLPPRR